ncbi:MAG: hypothetical protein M3275_12445 [Thermoproteota archaeon]|nr:hypothetical protein [Thermoproteota archaeon]
MATTNNKGETSILQFEFDEKIPIYGTITDSEDIEFLRLEENNNTYVTGFEITIKGSTAQKIADAKEQTAPRLTNILSSITGIAINYKPPKIRKIRNGQTFHVVPTPFTMVYSKSVGIDNIDISKLSSLLANESKLNMQLAHAYNGQRAFFSKDFPQAIREFYLVFEYTGRSEEQKYKNLRHAISHVRLDNPDAINDLQINFGIPIQAKQEIDLNDQAIKEILGRHASELRRSVGFYLNVQLKTN